MQLSQRIDNIAPSLTIAMSEKAALLKNEGKKILSFTAGEPDFKTPQIVQEAAIAAIKAGFNTYTPTAGSLDLLKAVQAKLKRENNLDYNLDELIVSNGGKHSIFNLMQVLLDKDDEVLIPTPYWVSYPEVVKFSAAKPIFLETTMSDHFKVKPEQIAKAINKKTKLFILNSPSNPTGSMYTKAELEAIAKVLENTQVLVLSDEIYEFLNYDQKFYSFANLSEDTLKRTIIINGISKCAAMTGWRMGYMATKLKNIVKACNKLQSQATSNICSITQQAAIKALDGSIKDDIEMMKKAFIERRNYTYKALNAIDGINCKLPSGAFYIFASIGNNKDCMKFCLDLLDQKQVALVPGVGFGMPGHFRLSYASALEDIKTGIARIESFIKQN